GQVIAIRADAWWDWSFFFQAEDGIRDKLVTGVQTCALPISPWVTVISDTSSAPTERRRYSRIPSPRSHASPMSLKTDRASLSVPKGRWPIDLPTIASGSRYSTETVAARWPRAAPPS